MLGKWFSYAGILICRRRGEGILLATEKYDEAEPVNLGSGMEISIEQLASMIASMTGFEGSLVWDKIRPNGQPRRVLDSTHGERSFGFKASDFIRGRITADNRLVPKGTQPMKEVE